MFVVVIIIVVIIIVIIFFFFFLLLFFCYCCFFVVGIFPLLFRLLSLRLSLVVVMLVAAFSTSRDSLVWQL